MNWCVVRITVEFAPKGPTEDRKMARYENGEWDLQKTEAVRLYQRDLILLHAIGRAVKEHDPRT